ncbi:hypothetical protein HYU14_02045 [Candidatus Woesearchaeota archaeon]|nr:hypothetical protein [Candidatus Woesearchaeota archaeon]
MNLLQFSLSAAVIVSGIYLGIALAFIAKEEIKPGKKYLELLKNALALGIASFFLLAQKFSFPATLIVLPALFLIVPAILTLPPFPSIQKKFGILGGWNIESGALLYLIFGVMYSLAFSKPQFTPAIGSLMFLYGLPEGTLLADTRSLKHSLFRPIMHLVFLAAGAGVYFLINP